MVTVKELQKLTKEKGCKGYSKLRKAELIEFLKTCVPIINGKKNHKIIPNLEKYKVKELRKMAKEKGCKGYSTLRKSELIEFLKVCVVYEKSKCNKNQYLLLDKCYDKINKNFAQEYEKSYDACKNSSNRRRKNWKEACNIIKRKYPDYYVYKILGSGVYGVTFLLCSKHKPTCDKVIKVGFSNRKDYEKEVRMQKIFAKYGFAPKILYSEYDNNNNNMVIIMDRIDTTLENYLMKNKSKDEINDIFSKIIKLIENIQEKGLVHADLHSGNIGLIQTKKGIQPILIDFGFSDKIDKKLANKYIDLELIQLYTTLAWDHSFADKPMPPKNYEAVNDNLKNIITYFYDTKYYNLLEKQELDDLLDFRNTFYEQLELKEIPLYTLNDYIKIKI